MVVGGLVLALGATAHAQSYPTCDRQPTAEDIEGAKGAHKAAQRFYDKGQYEDAIRGWTDAYKFDCTAHLLLINIGNAYEKLGDRQKAIDAFETYLQRMKEGVDPTIPDKVANLKDQLLKEKMRAQAAASHSASAAPPPPPSPPPEAGPSTGPGPWPWVLTGVGAAILIAGIPVTAIGQSKVHKAENACPTHQDCSADDTSLGNTGRTMTGVGIAMLAVGALATAGGITWYFVAPEAGPAANPAPAASLTLGPWAGPSIGGLSFSGAF